MKYHALPLARLAAALLLAGSLSAQAGTLVINTDASDPAPKAAFDAIIKGFEAANPDVKVKINNVFCACGKGEGKVRIVGKRS